jgi:lipopolysaccharide export system protein LptA
VDNIKRTLAALCVGGTLGLVLGVVTVCAQAAAAPADVSVAAATETAAPATATPPAAEKKSAPSAPQRPETLRPPAPSTAGEKAKPAATAEPLIQVSGRIIHTWEETAGGARIILAIDGFTVLTRTEQLTGRDGVIWFDEAEARRTGKAVLGIYAETGVEHKKAGGQIEKFDSVYLVMETTGEISLISEEKSLRGKAENTELYLRAKKLRDEYLKRGIRETPTGVVPSPEAGPKVPVPGVREAGVPQEISIVAQDDVRKVTFTSVVEEGVRISTWSGGIFMTRGDMDIAADNVIIWTPEEASKTAVAGPGAAAAPAAAADGKAPKKSLAAEAYFEGHVRVVQAHRTIQCSQMYYDFQSERALAINTKIATFSKVRNVPVYYYAKEVRQLAKGLFVGNDAWMTTCDFGEPHYDVHARKLTIEDLTPEAETRPAPGGAAPGTVLTAGGTASAASATVTGSTEEQPGGAPAPVYHRLRFVGEDVGAEVRQFPLTYWPRMAGDYTEADTALRSIRIENRSSLGTGFVTQWHLLKLLGIEDKTPGLNMYLDLDAWSKRGPATGIEGKYKEQDYYGDFQTYFINDHGKDKVDRENVAPPDPNRGRATWHHRQYLPDNWELTMEFSYISDRNFMHQFFRKEDETGKQQESLVYLKKQEHEQALTFMTSARIENFYTRTEYYPQVEYHVIGHSFWDDHLTYFQYSEVSEARYRPDEALYQQASPATLLADTIHEVDLPLKLGVVNVVPFVETRLTYFENSLDGGSKDRFAAREGVRASTQAWKVYNDVDSDLWDVHGLKHVNIFNVSAYAHQVSVPSRDLYPFAPTEDGVQTVNGVDSTGVTEVGWRQRFDTKRGPPDKQEIVDWITTDLEATFYSNRQFPGIAPEQGPEFDKLDFRARWRATDATTLWTEAMSNLDNGGSLAKFDIGALITQTPRLSYTVGLRYIPSASSMITFLGFDYQINDKWRVTVLEQYDIQQGQNNRTDLVFTRRMHRWLMRIKLSKDNAGGESFGGVEFQPIGIQEVKINW